MCKERHEPVVERMSDEQLEAKLRYLLAELELSASPAKEQKLDA
jgi:hypothetical protein